MTIVRSAKFCAVIAAAFTGLSLSVAYAAPAYSPASLSPLDATTLNSVSPLLNNFNQYLSAIDALLPSGKTLAFPDGGSETLPTDAEFIAAVASAVDAAVAGAVPTPAELDTVQRIVSAAVQYKPGKIKDILKSVAFTVPSVAPAVVSAASTAVPLKAPDAAAGAIFGLVAYSASLAELPTPPPPVPNSAYADAADNAVTDQTRDLIEKVAKAAVASTKKADSPGGASTEVAKALMTAFMADAVGSNAELYIDDLARGIINGVQGFATTDVKKSDLAVELFNKLAVPDLANPGKFLPAPGVTKDQVVNLAMGAIKGSAFVVSGTGNSYDDVSGAIITAAATLAANSTSPEFANINNEIIAASKIQKALRLNTTLTPQAVFSANLTPTEVPYLASYVSGAVQAVKAKAADFVTLAFEDASTGTLTVAQRRAVVAAAITGNFGATAKVVTNAVTSGTPNKLSAIDAVQAAIPAATEMYSGFAVLAAMKTVTGPTEVTDAEDLLAAGLNAANAVGYQSAFGDIASSASKAKKLLDNELVAKAVATVPNGWEEAVAAAIVANNPKDKPATPLGPTNRDAAIAAATTKGTADVASVALATQLAINGKASPKTLFDDAVEAIYDNPTKARAVLFGTGVVNNKLAVPLMSMLFRLQDGGDTRLKLREYAISLNKKAKLNIQLGFEAASDAVDSPDHIFDLVDHKILTNPKQAADILAAVVAARPEYAHYAARAAAYRAPSQVSKTAAAAIQYAHMRANRDAAGVEITNPDDPAAVAAISAAVVLGVKDAKLAPTKEEAAIKSAVAALVKTTFAFQNGLAKEDVDAKTGLVGSTADFAEATGLGTDINVGTNSNPRRAKGTAAVLTGAIAQLQIDDPTIVGNAELQSLSHLAEVAITAAAKAAKTHSLALAQAAGAAAAAAAIAGDTQFTDFQGIADAISLVTGTALPDLLKAAAEFGANQVLDGQYGPGAAGILNYGHVSGQGSPVTSLSNF